MRESPVSFVTMNFDGNFKRVGSANVASAKLFVEKLTDESWFQDDGDTTLQVIYLVHDDQLRHDQPTRCAALEVFGKPIRPILAITADYFDASPYGRRSTEKLGAGYFVRARMLRVMNGATFRWKEDVVFSETHSHRIHVPIISNEKVEFTVGDETLCVPEGEIYEINNRRSGEISSAGSGACVHLLLDYVLKGEMCCCGKSRSPQEPCGPEVCFATDRVQSACHCFAEAAG